MLLELLHWLGYGVCHQIPERTIHLAGQALPLCARCSGIYLGAVIGFGFMLATGRGKTGIMPPVPVLAVLYGDADYSSPPLPFDISEYYQAEMGSGLTRRFVAFRRLVPPDALAAVKLATIELEAALAVDGRRQVNLDPAYLSAGKLVLATTKNQQHRIYLGQGVFAEVALRYRDGAWRAWEWTYRDYRSPEYARVFDEIRALYMAQRPPRS